MDEQRDRITTLTDEFARLDKLKGFKQGGVIALGLATSLIPFVGGPISYVADKIATRALEPDLAPLLLEVSNAVAAIIPNLDRIDLAEARIDAVATAIRGHGEILQRLIPLIQAGAQDLLDEHTLENNGGLQEVVDHVVRNMRLIATTDGGGTSTFERIDHQGPSRFSAGPGSVQRISGSTFAGRSPGVETKTTYGQEPAENHGATIEHHAGDGNTVRGMRISVTVRPGDPPGRRGVIFKTTVR